MTRKPSTTPAPQGDPPEVLTYTAHLDGESTWTTPDEPYSGGSTYTPTRIRLVLEVDTEDGPVCRDVIVEPRHGLDGEITLHVLATPDGADGSTVAHIEEWTREGWRDVAEGGHAPFWNGR